VDLVRDVIVPMIESGERVFAYEFADYWEDVGTVETYYRASMEILALEPRLRLYEPEWPILTRDEERPPVIFGSAAHVASSLVAGGCRVNGKVVNSVLFPGVVVEEGATIRDAVLFSDTIVRAGALVERAIVDKYVEVGERARLGGPPSRDQSGAFGGEDLTLVGKEVVVPPGVHVGRGCTIGVGAGPRELSGGQVPDGAVVPGPASAGSLR
jgi:glucose-1-phosphate adenylyltransferase